MPSKFCRHPREAPLRELPLSQPDLEVPRLTILNLMQRMISEGMCMSAMVMAQDHCVQFNPDTLRSWAKDRRKDPQFCHRKTYAWLVRTAVQTAVSIPVQTPALAPVVPSQA